MKMRGAPCAECGQPTPHDSRGWVILLDGRLLCNECYRAMCEARNEYAQLRGEAGRQ